MKTLEVRCCCDATKVLGHLAHPQLQKPGDRCVFPIFDATVEVCRAPEDSWHMRELKLTVDEIVEHPHADFGPARLVPAIKNRDYPLEDLKRIPGFVVNNVVGIDG